MTERLDGVIRVTPEMNEVYYERHFDAPLERLWAFIAEPELLAKWMGGPVDKLELVKGGDVLIRIHPEWGATVYGKVYEVDPMRVLAFTWDVPAWGNTPDLLGTTMRWETEADGDGSKIKLTHALPHAVGREHLLMSAWHFHLDQLDALLAGRDVAYVIERDRILDMTLRYVDMEHSRTREYYTQMIGHM